MTRSRSAASPISTTRWSAVDAGADALGFIFVENTPRFVTPEQVAPIVRALPPFVTPVGIFWDHPAGSRQGGRRRRAGCGRCSSTATRSRRTSRATRCRSSRPSSSRRRDHRRGSPACRSDASTVASWPIASARPRSCSTAPRAGARARPASRSSGTSRRRPGDASGARIILSAGLTPENVAARDRDGAAVRGRRELGRGGAAGPEGPRQGAALRRRGQARAVMRAGCPTRAGHFGRYGGRFVPETLMAPLIELEQAYARGPARPEVPAPPRTACSRTTPAGPRRSTSPTRLTEHCGGARI